MKNLLPVLAAVVLLASCSGSTSEKNSKTAETKIASKKDSTASSQTPSGPGADAATIIARQQVPVLCYHHITEGVSKGPYTVTATTFKQQMQILADSGYHSILPEQYYNYLVYGTPLPSKPFMITYDDTDLEQFTIGKTEMDKHGFKGVYFIMNISIGRPRYMTKELIKQLSDEGNVIGCHTYDHNRVDRYKFENTIEFHGRKQMVNDFDFQITDTKKKLEEITGKPVDYFAYPFGLWNKNALPEIKKRGIKMAFQLSDKRDPDYPLYTVRRIIIAPTWTAQGLLRVMRSTFK
jgi:peptidoglycan/xylan/chitin deacetylase (PgdA/CDA1 family)